MRKVLRASAVFAAFVFVAATVFVVNGCTDTEQVSVFSPIYLSYSELRTPVSADDPAEDGIDVRVCYPLELAGG